MHRFANKGKLMRFCSVLLILLLSCDHSNRATGNDRGTLMSASMPSDTAHRRIARSSRTIEKYRVIVLPPYDRIANEGISPDVQKYLENDLAKDTGLTLIRFPYKDLMDVPYHNVYDRKYCKPILDKVRAEIVIMSKLDQVTRTGNMETDTWDLSFRIYNVDADRQVHSKITLGNLTDRQIRKELARRCGLLIAEIKDTSE